MTVCYIGSVCILLPGDQWKGRGSSGNLLGVKLEEIEFVLVADLTWRQENQLRVAMEENRRPA